MLRALVLIIGLLVLRGGIVGLVAGALPPAAVFAVWGVLIVVGTLYERFVDDETGRNVTVYVRTATGERKYVDE